MRTRTPGNVKAFLLPCILLALVACGGGGGGQTAEPPSGDTLAPAAPYDVTASATTSSTVTVAWLSAFDNVGITGYRIFRNGELLRTATSSPIGDSGLTVGIRYCYRVSALDAAGNESDRSSAACATPQRATPVAALAAPSSAFPDTLLTFDASASHAPESTLVNYVFDFGDGSALLSQATPVIRHRYPAIGTFVASVTVTDNFAATATATVVLTIGLVLEPPVNVSRTPNYSHDPSLFRGADGTIHVAFEDADSIMYSQSADGGRTFSDPLYVNGPTDPWGLFNGFSSAYAKVVAAGDNVHVVWTIYDQYRGAEVFSARSRDRGTTFSDPAMFSPADAINSYEGSVAAEEGGTVLISWTDQYGPGQGIHYARSIDNAETFPLQAMMRGTFFALCSQVMVSSNQIDMAWMEQSGEQAAKVMFARSEDGAQTFSDPIELDHSPEMSGCPTLARGSDDTLYAVWTEGLFGNRKTFIAVSTDDGASFGNPVTLSAPNEEVTCQTVAAGANGHVYVAWTRESSTYADSYLNFSLDSGRTFSPALRIDAGAFGGVGCFKILIIDNDRIGPTWQTLHNVESPGEIYFAIAEISQP